MRTILILSFGVIIVSCGQPKTSRDSKVLLDIKTYLPAGQREAEIIDLKKSTRQDTLNKKLYQAVKQNWDWYLVVAKKAKTSGGHIPYDTRLGLTKEEYTELLQSNRDSNKGEFVKSATETVIIKQIGDKITFQSKGQLDILNKLTFDLTESVVMIDEQRLDIVDTINVTNDKNPFKSSWKGYRWEFNASKNKWHSDSKLRPISVTLGRLSKNEKIYMRIHTIDLREVKPTNSQIQLEL